MPNQINLPELSQTLKQGLGNQLSSEYQNFRASSNPPKSSDLEGFADKVLAQILRLQNFNGTRKNLVENTLVDLRKFLFSIYDIAGKNQQAIAAKVAAVNFNEGEKEELLDTIAQVALIRNQSDLLGISSGVCNEASSGCCR